MKFYQQTAINEMGREILVYSDVRENGYDNGKRGKSQVEWRSKKKGSS
jgi:hypothetical protein